MYDIDEDILDTREDVPTLMSASVEDKRHHDTYIVHELVTNKVLIFKHFSTPSCRSMSLGPRGTV